MVSHFAEDLLMPTYNGIEVTEDFYTFFAPHFLPLISPIRDPREQDNVKLTYSVSAYLSVIILGICQGATTMRQPLHSVILTLLVVAVDDAQILG